jgi:hypothetical protein
MDYDSLFSASVKQKIRRIVEDAETPALMTARVAAQFGDAAISLASQTAAEVKGLEWLRQEQSIETTPSGESQSDDTLDCASEPPPKSKPLAMALARGRAAKAAALKLPETKAEEVTLEAQIPAARRLGVHAGIVARGLWNKYSSFIWLLLIVAFIAKCVDDNEKQKFIDEKASVGTLATVTGSMLAAAYKSCNLIGQPAFERCALSSGILVQDMVARQLASAGIDQRKKYIETCARHYAQEYCWDQLNRAFRISVYSER